MIEYRGFTIEPKRDFGPTGFYINGKFTKIGYVAVKDGCNAGRHVVPYDRERQRSRA